MSVAMPKNFAEGFVDHLHAALLVQEKNPFDHAVEEGLLADLELGMELLLFPAGLLVVMALQARRAIAGGGGPATATAPEPASDMPQ